MVGGNEARTRSRLRGNAGGPGASQHQAGWVGLSGAGSAVTGPSPASGAVLLGEGGAKASPVCCSVGSLGDPEGRTWEQQWPLPSF